MKDRIQIDVADHVADVRLVRANKMNALDDEMFSALIEAGETLRTMKGVRAIILSGAGAAFCAGLDLSMFSAGPDRGVRQLDLRTRTHGPANMLQQAMLQWRALPAPVIAAVHGAALGGGFQLMLGADMRFVAPDAKLSLMEMKWGLVPDLGGILMLRDLVRPDVAADLIYTGRVFDGAEAFRLGLATRLCDDPRKAALTAAAEIAAKSPDAVKAAKRLLSVADLAMAEKILLSESLEQTALLGSPNQIEALQAVLEKRSAKFVD